MSKDYKAYLRSPEWQSFRAKILERDGDVCTNCGKGVEEGRVLQIHHKYYSPDKKPWQYPIECCVTLCKGCHAAIHGVVPPNCGWEFVSKEDVGDSTCEYCGTEIRYVFTIFHPYYGFMEVGTVCCDNLTGTTTASEIKGYTDRRQRFVSSRRWKQNVKEGFCLIEQKELRIKIVVEGKKYRIWINGKRGGTQYETLNEAKCRAFDVVEDGSAQLYLDREGRAPSQMPKCLVQLSI